MAAVCVVIGLLLPSGSAQAAPRLEVHGASRLDAQAVASHAMITVSGSLLDDADRAIAGATITVTFVTESGAPLAMRACDGDPPAASSGERTTAADGTFCARAEGRPGKTHVALTWPGTRLYGGTQAELSIEASRRAVTIAFDPDPRVVALGEGAQVVDAVANVAGESAGAPPPLDLRLADERGTLLAKATTDAAGRARFVVPANLLGPPGPGEMRLSFDGDAIYASATHVSTCERRVAVRVSARDGDHADAVEEDDGAALDLDVTAATGDAPLSGSVEAIFEGAVIGVAPVVSRRAHLIVRWPGPPAQTTWLEARYVPESTAYVAAPPTRIDVTVSHPAPWRRTVVLLVGVGILAAFITSRSRRRAVAAPPTPTKHGPNAMDVAHVARVVAYTNDEKGWDGHVVDAHERAPLAGVRVAIERAAFDGIETLAVTTTDADGAFTLPPMKVRPGDQVAAEGPLHGRFATALPASGVLDVALVSRRRSLLHRLVRWAKERGVPFDARPEATPGHVRRVAGEDDATSRWAAAVEDAAYGGGVVDADVEAEVDRLGRRDVGPHGSSPPRR